MEKPQSGDENIIICLPSHYYNIVGTIYSMSSHIKYNLYFFCFNLLKFKIENNLNLRKIINESNNFTLYQALKVLCKIIYSIHAFYTISVIFMFFF